MGSYAIRTRNGPAGGSLDHIGVRLIVGRRHCGRQPLSGLDRRNRGEIPASKNGIQELRPLQKMPLSERQLVHARRQEDGSRLGRCSSTGPSYWASLPVPRSEFHCADEGSSSADCWPPRNRRRLSCRRARRGRLRKLERRNTVRHRIVEGSKPRKTTPMAPRPSSEFSLYGPIDSMVSFSPFLHLRTDWIVD
jgi:hypothetical protein